MRLGLCGDDSGELELIFMSSSSSFEIRDERNLSFDFRRASGSFYSKASCLPRGGYCLFVYPPGSITYSKMLHI